MKELSLYPFHIFEYRGMGFVLDQGSHKAFRIDHITRSFLQAILDGYSTQGARELIAQQHSPEEADEIQREYFELQALGYLKNPVMSYSSKDEQNTTRRLLGMKTGRISLYLAQSCNLRCKYCYACDNDAVNKGKMPLNIAQKAVDLAFRRCGNTDEIQVTFLGGEPLMNRDVLFSVVDYADDLAEKHGKNIRYSLTTNATLMDEAIAKLIARRNFGLMLSIDGPPQLHDEMRLNVNGKGSFVEAEKGFRLLKRFRRTITTRATVCHGQLENIKERVNYLENMGFTRIALSCYKGRVEEESDYELNEDDYKSLLDQEDEIFLDFIKRAKPGQRIAFDPFTSIIASAVDLDRAPVVRCGVCRGCTTVDIDGLLYPCHRYVGMEEYVMGDVDSGINPDKHRKYLEGYISLRQHCESCWAVNICGGVCPWAVSNADGTFQPYPNWRCDVIRRNIERGFWMYELAKEECPDYLESIIKPSKIVSEEK